MRTHKRTLSGTIPLARMVAVVSLLTAVLLLAENRNGLAVAPATIVGILAALACTLFPRRLFGRRSDDETSNNP